MKRSILLAPLLLASPVLAADPIRIAPTLTTPAPVHDNWTGFYAGVNAGFGWGASDMTLAGAPIPTLNGINGILGGAQVGYNIQLGTIVLGAEADIQAAHLARPLRAQTVTMQYFGTMRARLGVDLEGFMPYVTGGIAAAGGHIDPPASSRFHSGWTAGAGLEAKVSDNLSLKAEYLHFELGEQVYYPHFGNNVAANLRADIVRAGVNFHF